MSPTTSSTSSEVSLQSRPIGAIQAPSDLSAPMQWRRYVQTTIQQIEAERRPLVSGGITNSANVVSDCRWIAWMGPPFESNSLPLAAMGMQSGINLSQGLLGIEQAKRRYDYAQTSKNAGGKNEAIGAMVYSSMQAVGGAGFLGFRALQIYSLVQQWLGTTSSLAASTASTVFLNVGCIAFAIFFGFIGCLSSYKFYKSRQFRSELAQADDKMAFLRERLNTHSQEKWNALTAAAKQDLRKRTLTVLTSRAPLTKKDVFEKCQLTTMQKNALIQFGLDPSTLDQEDPIALLGFLTEQTLQQQVLEEKLGELIGPEALATLKNNPKPEDLQALCAQIEQACSQKEKRYLFYMVTCLLGVILMALIPMASPPLMLMVSLTITVVLAMLKIDFNSAQEGLKAAGPTGKWDKTYLATTTGILILETALSLMLMCTFEEMNVKLLALTLGVCAMGLYLYFDAYKKTVAKESAYNSAQEKLQKQIAKEEKELLEQHLEWVRASIARLEEEFKEAIRQEEIQEKQLQEAQQSAERLSKKADTPPSWAAALRRYFPIWAGVAR